MRKSIYVFFFFMTFIFGNTKIFSQVALAGPVCTIPGVTYEYSISGPWDSTSTMKVCVTGGAITDSTDTVTCTVQGIPLKAVTVIWNSVTNGSIVLTTSSGNATLPINITVPLSGGYIDSSVKTQLIGIDSIPLVIVCSAAQGGGCSPSYSYQWQKSSDVVSWFDIPLATNQNLSVDSGISESIYYRRKVIENTSGSIGYSDAAAVFVGVDGAFKTPANINTYCMRNQNFDRMWMDKQGTFKMSF